MATLTGFTINKLGESNYKTWKSDITDILLQENLWFVVSGEESAPTSSEPATELLRWKERKAKAAATIRLAMEMKIRAHYTDVEFLLEPTAVWKKIKVDRKEVIALDENYLYTQLFQL
jgi:hypothetical protein